MAETVIDVARIAKRYRIGLKEQLPETVLAAGWNFLTGPVKNYQRLRGLTAFDAADDNDDRSDIVWALRDVSFQVPHGQIVGVIGRNGSGKSTLLKILSRITEPTSGRAVIDGRVGSLLEVGTGFHPELSGRDNIYMNGTILGMRRAEIDRKFDEIVDFSGVETFIDTPVKRYSSGMAVRLAFAVAAHLEPEILVIDEVLAVGDVEFQQKCLGKIRSVATTGRTVLFVSHNMAAVRSLCDRAILLDRGQIVADGPAHDTVSRYLQRYTVSGAVASHADLQQRVHGVINVEAPAIRFREIAIVDEGGTPRQTFHSDQQVSVSVTFECFRRVEDLRVVLYLQDGNGLPLLASQNLDDAAIVAHQFRLDPGVYRAVCAFPPNSFGEQRFAVDVHLEYPKVEHLVAERILTFDVAFKGYNNVLQGCGTAYFRPRLAWQLHPCASASSAAARLAAAT